MSATIPVVVRPTSCCQPSCDDVVYSQVPGPAGANGVNGVDGVDGVNPFTTVATQFVMPAIGANVSVNVVDSTWAAIGQVVFVQSAGYFSVNAKVDDTHMTLTNLGYTGNAAPATVIAVANQVSPSGIKGTDGVSSTGGLAGNGSPEGVQTAAPGTPYLDVLTDSFWMKKAGVGDTGWIQLIA